MRTAAGTSWAVCFLRQAATSGSASYAAEQADITDDRLGGNRVFFLPYLMGERSPINDTDARGTFVGLSLDIGRTDMVQAVLEGVAFALRDSLEVAKAIGLSIDRSFLCGGGAKSPLWRKILANVLNISLDIPQTEEGPGYGGAMLAMVGTPTPSAMCGRRYRPILKSPPGTKPSTRNSNRSIRP